MNEKLRKQIFIGLFTVLYAMTGLVSIYHAVGFFMLANPGWMAWVLAIVFEIGQAAALFSILSGGNNKVSWALMGILTIVQIMGNVYSCYAWVVTQPEMIVHFAGPFFGPNTTLTTATQAVIIAYIMGAILPVVALCLTAVVSKYIIPKIDIKTEKKGDIFSIEKPSKIDENQEKSDGGWKSFIDN